jgi:hypothetical protein
VLLRERIVISILFIIAVLSFVDILTPQGNIFWERYVGFPGRYAIMQGDKIGYVNGRCRLVIAPKFDQGASYFKDGLSPASTREKWGYINTDGSWVIAAQFLWAGEFKEGLAGVLVPKGWGLRKYGFINGKGELTIPGIYARIHDFSEGAAAVMSAGVWGFIGQDGQWLNTQRYADIKDFSEGLAAAKEKELWGFVDRSGIFLIRPQFEDVKSFTEGLAPAKINTRWGYIDRTGRWILEPKWSVANNFSSGLAIADGNYIDRAGNVAIVGGRFGEINDFSEGFASVEVPIKERFSASKWGYIDRTGKFLIDPRFEVARSFKGGLARVSKDKNGLQRGYAFTDGRLVWDPADWEKSATFIRNVRVAQTIFGFLLGIIVLKFLRYRNRNLYYIHSIS